VRAPSRTGALSAAAYAGMFLFGIAFAVLGATLPLLSERLDIGLGRVGTLFLVMNACMLVSSFGLGALQDRYGMKPPLVGGPLVVGAALAVVAVAGSFAHLLAGIALLGVGGAALNGASNALVADLHEDPAAKSAALSRVGVFFGFGAISIPFVIGLLVRAAGLRGILACAAMLCGAVAVANVLPAYPAPKQGGGLSLAEAARFAREPVVLLLGFLLFFESGNEFIVGGYTTTFLTREIGMPVASASYVLAGFWLALMLARAALGGGRFPLSGPALVVASAVASAAAVLLLVTASRPAVAIAMAVILGATLAGIYPAVLGLAGARYPAHSGTVFGVLFTMALTGGMTLPWVTGHAAAGWGLRPAIGLVVLQFLAVAALQWAVTAVRARPPSASSR
jgi:FHS family glucose/mannose:H+ symporter-like MFS transporter